MHITYKLFALAGICAFTIPLNNQVLANDKIEEYKEIKAFYQSFIDSKLSGGDEMIGFLERHFDNAGQSIERISNIFPDTDADEEGVSQASEEMAMKRDKAMLLDEMQTIARIVEYKDMEFILQDVQYVQGAINVKWRRAGEFVMTRYGIRKPFNVKEDSICSDELKEVQGVLKITKTDCVIKLYIDHK